MFQQFLSHIIYNPTVLLLGKYPLETLLCIYKDFQKYLCNIFITENSNWSKCIINKRKKILQYLSNGIPYSNGNE